MIAQVTIRLKNGHLLTGESVERIDTLLRLERPSKYPDAKALAIPVTAVEKISADSAGRHIDLTFKYISTSEWRIPNSGATAIFKFKKGAFPDTLFKVGSQHQFILKSGDTIEGTVIEYDQRSVVIRTQTGNIPIALQDLASVQNLSEEKSPELASSLNKPLEAHRLSDPFAAGFLSLLLPGMGQVYNGEYVHGGIIFGIWATSLALHLTGSQSGSLVHHGTPETTYLLVAGVAHLFAVGEAIYFAEKQQKVTLTLYPSSKEISLTLNMRF
ncbi:MAG: hypothetical protein ACP5JH_00695 [Bacteroidota bacterium]